MQLIYRRPKHWFIVPYKLSINVFALCQDVCVTGFTYATVNNTLLL